ncbi:transposase family protein [Streptomyces sp. NPDC003688]
MRGVLRAEPLWVETFTGLRMRQFERLLKVVCERGGNGPGRGRPWCLPLAGRVLLVAVYYRTNLTMRQLAPLFGCSSTTVCRVIQRLRPLLAIKPATRPAEAVGRLWIVGGALIPVRDRKVGASSRNYRFSANVQVIIDADTKLVVAAGRQVPGDTADARAWRDSGLADRCAGVTVLADGAYINTGLVVPHRKRPGHILLPGEEEDNAEHRKVRVRVEYAFARLKHYKILRDCRQRGNGLHHAVQAVAHMHNLTLAA